MSERNFRDWLDQLGRRHPWLMFLSLIIMTILVTLALLYHNDPPSVLYQGF